MVHGLIGRKLGMTQIFDEQGLARPVTVIEAGPCVVTQVRSTEKDGYDAVQLGIGRGSTKKAAEQEAAAQALDALQAVPSGEAPERAPAAP